MWDDAVVVRQERTPCVNYGQLDRKSGKPELGELLERMVMSKLGGRVVLSVRLVLARTNQSPLPSIEEDPTHQSYVSIFYRPDGISIKC